jgi:hypothetical protein
MKCVSPMAGIVDAAEWKTLCPLLTHVQSPGSASDSMALGHRRRRCVVANTVRESEIGVRWRTAAIESADEERNNCRRIGPSSHQ